MLAHVIVEVHGADLRALFRIAAGFPEHRKQLSIVIICVYFWLTSLFAWYFCSMFVLLWFQFVLPVIPPPPSGNGIAGKNRG